MSILWKINNLNILNNDKGTYFVHDANKKSLLSKYSIQPDL
jgi:hypothetical protein